MSAYPITHKEIQPLRIARIKTVVERGIVFHTVEGRVTNKEFIETFKATLQHPDFQPGMGGFCDLRNGELGHLTGDDLYNLAYSLLQQNEERGPTHKLALVVADDLNYGLARMYSAYTENSPVEVRVFRDTAEAISWLEGSSDS